jgi:predicted metalloprotease with PDZ domain
MIQEQIAEANAKAELELVKTQQEDAEIAARDWGTIVPFTLHQGSAGIHLRAMGSRELICVSAFPSSSQAQNAGVKIGDLLVSVQDATQFHDLVTVRRKFEDATALLKDVLRSEHWPKILTFRR